MDKRRIREVIVVEGVHDSANLKKYYDCETIITHGTHIGSDVMDEIKQCQNRVGVIVFTDPDAPGNMIRHRINEAVPGCLNAFVNKKDARTSKKVGVEHADFEALEEALSSLVTWSDQVGSLTMEDMFELGLTGSDDSAFVREKLGEKLQIGNGNSKTMLGRLNHLGIGKDELKEILEEIGGE